MIKWGARYFLSLSLLSYAAASVYGIATGGNIIGTLSVGYRNGVGEHLGYGIAIALTFGFAVLGVIAVLTREGVVVDSAGIARSVDPVERSNPSPAPLLLALAAALTVTGVALGTIFLVAGLVLGFVVGMQWALQAWSDSISDDPTVAGEFKSRVGGIFDIPMTSLALIGFIVIGLSRILLALPAAWATAVVSVVALLIFVGAAFFAKKSPSRNVIVGVLGFGALAVLVGAIVSAGIGERSFDHEEEAVGESVDE